MKKKLLILLLLGLVLLVSSCKTKEVPGRRRTPRHCNSCTKWSYVPQETLELEILYNDKGWGTRTAETLFPRGFSGDGG